MRWAAKGIWADIFGALASAGGPLAEVLIDGSAVKPHRRASGRPLSRHYRLLLVMCPEPRSYPVRGTPQNTSRRMVPKALVQRSPNLGNHTPCGWVCEVKPRGSIDPEASSTARGEAIVATSMCSAYEETKGATVGFTEGAAVGFIGAGSMGAGSLGPPDEFRLLTKARFCAIRGKAAPFCTARCRSASASSRSPA